MVRCLSNWKVLVDRSNAEQSNTSPSSADQHQPSASHLVQLHRVFMDGYLLVRQIIQSCA
jgi:hypothetical protein